MTNNIIKKSVDYILRHFLYKMFYEFEAEYLILNIDALLISFYSNFSAVNLCNPHLLPQSFANYESYRIYRVSGNNEQIWNNSVLKMIAISSYTLFLNVAHIFLVLSFLVKFLSNSIDAEGLKPHRTFLLVTIFKF